MPRDYDAKIAQLSVNTIKMLSIDAVEKAKSGHPGTPMGLADIAFEIWAEFLRFDPKDPTYFTKAGTYKKDYVLTIVSSSDTMEAVVQSIIDSITAAGLAKNSVELVRLAGQSPANVA